MEKLTQKEMKKRMQEWRNIKVLHRKAVEQNKKLKKKINTLEEDNLKKDQIIFEQLEVLENFKLRIEELERMVFGRKKKKNKDDEEDDFRPKKEKKEPKKRDKDSYKRPAPDEEDVTAHEYHDLNPDCPDCGTSLQDKETVVFYEEDIPLPDKKTKLKQVIKHHAEKGYCPECRKWHWAMDHPFTDVFLGSKVRFYIAYLSILMRLTFSQIQSILWDTYHFKISEGEIAKILHQTADKLRPEFERIKKRLQEGKGVHLDETSGGNGTYMWVMASMDTEDVLYLAGRTRGKGNADELLGDSEVKRITDAYAVYLKQRGRHQQCWSHPHTKLKNLAYSKTLTKEKRKHCYKTYEEFSKIYEKLRGYIEEDFNPEKRAKQKKELFRKIEKFRKFHKKDPKKLHNVKQQFHDYLNEWLTCMDFDGMPCDNNKAERMIRHFVIKRKISFGNRSEKGYVTYETLASVLMTYWKTHKNTFFRELSQLCLQGV